MKLISEDYDGVVNEIELSVKQIEAALSLDCIDSKYGPIKVYPVRRGCLTLSLGEYFYTIVVDSVFYHYEERPINSIVELDEDLFREKLEY